MRLHKLTPPIFNTPANLLPTIFLTFCLCLFYSFNVWASDAALQWDDNVDADYYIVYWRTADDSEPIDQSEPIDANTTSFPLYASDGKTEYYYSVKAFNAYGNSSDCSNEIVSTLSPYMSAGQTTSSGKATYAVRITLPDKAMFDTKTLIDFSADIYIDEVLTSYDNVSWKSSQDGLIGTGAEISTYLSAGTHTIMVTVYDGETEVASNILVLSVLESNTAPEITITSSISGTLDKNGHVFTFTGKASDAEDGDLSKAISWSSNLDGALGVGSRITASLSAGTHTITARITDSEGQAVDTSTSVTAGTWNAPPTLTIEALANESLTPLGQTYTLTGVAKDSEDGDLCSAISWVSSRDGDLGTGASVSPTLSAGKHSITAAVSDSSGQMTAAQLSIIVQAYNFPPELSISLKISGELTSDGQAVTLSGSAQDTEDGNISGSISWSSSIDGTLGTAQSLEAILAPGTHKITAQVTDSQNKTTKIQQSITIEKYNNAPTIKISATTSGDPSPNGQPYKFTAMVTDKEDGTLTSINWTSDIDGSLGTGLSVNANLSTGSHTITASVEDSNGQTASATILIMVAAYNYPPQISIDSVEAGVLSSNGQAYLLTGSAKDTEDGNLNGSIKWTSSIDGDIGTGTPVKANLSSGTHTITATVTDSKDQSVRASQSIVVDTYNDAPRITITSATAGTLTSTGQPYTFKGSATDQEDGDLSANIIWTYGLSETIGTGPSVTLNLTPGDHVIRAIITDSGGKYQTASREITVEKFDAKPSIKNLKAVGGKKDYTGQAFTLSASSEDNEDGDLSNNISWSSNLQGSLGSGSSINVHLNKGTHTITARIQDSFGNQTSAFTTVTSVAADSPPVLSIIEITGGQSTKNGQAFTFSCSASDKEDGDLSSEISWSSSAEGAMGTGAVLQAFIPLGNHTVTARVTDSKGQTTETTKAFTSVWVNYEPTVQILSVNYEACGSEGQVYTFKGSASDKEDGDLSGLIIWTSNLMGDIGEGAEITVTLSEGTHTITARIADLDGKKAQAGTSVTVAPYNEAPTVEIVSVVGLDAEENGQTFEFEGTASDEEDGDLSDSIVWSSDVDGVLGTGAGVQALLSSGEHTIKAWVKDSRNKEAEKTVMTQVKDNTGITIKVSSKRFYYFTIVTVTWSGATSNVDIMKDDYKIGSGGTEGTRYFWFSGAGIYKVCEKSGANCSEEVTVK